MQLTALKRWLLAGGGLALLLSLGGLLFFRPAATPPPTPTPTSWPLPHHFDAPEVGVNVHLWWDPWAAVRRDWPLVEQGGFAWVKQRLSWVDVEGAGPGHYAWNIPDRIVGEAEQIGVKLLFRVDHAPDWALTPEGAQPFDVVAFGEFCAALAERYAGRVAAYQVWNEPNLAREWVGRTPDTAGYVAALRACYVGIKAADPRALVVSAGLAPTGSGPPDALPDVDYLIGMYAAGAASYFDLLGLNAPGYKAPPEIAPEVAADPAAGYGGHSFFCFRHVETMRAIMEQHGDAAKQVAILEFGWHTAAGPEHPDYAWFAVTPEEQADYLVRAFEYAAAHWTPWIGPLFVWNIPDSHWTPENEEYWWGIVEPFWWGFDGDFEAWGGGDVRPAYEALREMGE